MLLILCSWRSAVLPAWSNFMLVYFEILRRKLRITHFSNNNKKYTVPLPLPRRDDEVVVLVLLTTTQTLFLSRS